MECLHDFTTFFGVPFSIFSPFTIPPAPTSLNLLIYAAPLPSHIPCCIHAYYMPPHSYISVVLFRFWFLSQSNALVSLIAFVHRVGFFPICLYFPLPTPFRMTYFVLCIDFYSTTSQTPDQWFDKSVSESHTFGLAFCEWLRLCLHSWLYCIWHVKDSSTVYPPILYLFSQFPSIPSSHTPCYIIWIHFIPSLMIDIRFRVALPWRRSPGEGAASFFSSPRVLFPPKTTILSRPCPPQLNTHIRNPPSHTIHRALECN